MKSPWVLSFLLANLINLVSAFSVPLQINYLATWGGDDDVMLQLHHPEGIAISPSGRLYIADTGSHRILLLTLKGKLVRSIGGQGWGQDQFDRPVAVDASNGLDVFVADYNNRRLIRYDKDLNYLATIEKQDDWSESYDLGYPLDVALSPLNHLYCIDDENSRVLMMDLIGAPLFILGDYDAGAGQLVDPVEICVRPDRSIWILDSYTSVVIFDEYGNYNHHWKPIDTDRFCGMIPCGNWGLCLIDLTKNRLLIVNEAGKSIGIFNANLHPLVNFNKPVHAAYYDSMIFILDREQGQVHVFRVVQNRQD